MKQKTKISCDHNDIIFEKDVTVTTKEREKLTRIMVANASRLSSIEADLGICVSIIQKNKTDPDVFKFIRRSTYPVYKDDFDNFEKDVKEFMDWFTQKQLPEELSAEKEQLKKSFEDCKMRAVVTLMQLASLLEELHSLNTRIFVYEKNEPEVPTDAQKA